jgi:protein involved in polysaccharide export with SLBB domain
VLVTNFFRSVLVCIAIAIALGPTVPVHAQIPSSLEEQFELYQSLSPTQQQALLQQLPASQRQAVQRILRQQPALATDSQGATVPDQDRVLLASQLSAGLVDEEDDTESIGAGDTLVIDFRIPDPADRPNTPVLTSEQRAARESFVARLNNENPYELDTAGRLHLPGVRPIELAGLDVELAVSRLGAESQLRPLAIELTRLTLTPVGIEALEPYGRDFFRGTSSLLASTGNIPIPVDYVVGPGDTVLLQLRGDPNVNGEYTLPVDRDGTINLPELGPLNVSGQRFDAVRELIDERIGAQMIGVAASVTLGELRSISVRVLGEVVRPGTYTLNPLVTMVDALFRAGGVNEIGSLRRIELRNGAEAVSTLDLYDLLLRGDDSGDLRLQQGYTIFVPVVGDRVAVDGEVLRPAIYELNGERSPQQVVVLAGGLRATASSSELVLERIVPGRGIEVVELGLDPAESTVALRDGDVLRVEANLDLLEGAVRLVGNVERGGVRSWYPGMTLSRLLPSPEFVRPTSDLNYVLIRREPRPNVEVEALSVNLEAVWAGRPGAVDLELQPRDTVYVFHRETGRGQYVAPIVEEIKAQAGSGEPEPAVRVFGEVRASGEYPLEPAMRVSDLLRAGGGMSDSAYAVEAELTRYRVVDGEQRETEVVPIDLAAVLAGDVNADILLAPYDYLSISGVSGWRGDETVTLVGEFRRPGTYTIRRGETLSSVVERAGGTTEFAFIEGSVFTRVALKALQEEENERLAARIEANLATRELSEDGASDALETGQVLLQQLRETEVSGRQVIGLDQILDGVMADIILDDGDTLYVPELRQQVTVIGEVQYPTSHTFVPGLSRDDYVARSGGLTSRADKGRIYVVRANGNVETGRGGRWFRGGAGDDVRPGDTVVAPINVDRVRPLQLWGEVAQIVYSMAIAAAAVNSF